MYEHLVKSPAAIAKMRIAGRLAASVLDMITDHVQPGVSTEKLNQLCHKFICEEEYDKQRRNANRKCIIKD